MRLTCTGCRREFELTTKLQQERGLQENGGWVCPICRFEKEIPEMFRKEAKVRPRL